MPIIVNIVIIEVSAGDEEKGFVGKMEQVYQLVFGTAKRMYSSSYQAGNGPVAFLHPDKACSLVKPDFDVAIAELGTSSEESYQNSREEHSY